MLGNGVSTDDVIKVLRNYYKTIITICDTDTVD